METALEFLTSGKTRHKVHRHWPDEVKPFFSPIWTSAVLNTYDFLPALGGFVLLTAWKTPPWTVVVLLTLGGLLS